MTFDLHTAAIEGFFSIAVEHLSAVALLAEAARSFVEGPSIVVAPDLGAVKLAKLYAQYLELPLAVVHKIRQSGETVSVQHVLGDVRDRALVIVDDMLSTGGTVAASMNALLAAGCRPPDRRRESWLARRTGRTSPASPTHPAHSHHRQRQPAAFLPAG